MGRKVNDKVLDVTLITHFLTITPAKTAKKLMAKYINLEWVIDWQLAYGIQNMYKEHIWQAHLHMCHVHAQEKMLGFICGLKSMCILINNAL